jgi:hypothetical protein
LAAKEFFDDAHQFLKSMRAVVDKRDLSRELNLDIREVAMRMMNRYPKRPLNAKLGRGR